jgi:hypothetical protein
MSVLGDFGGSSGEDIAERHKIEASIATETDISRLAKLVAFDQVVYEYDPCGKSWRYINPDLTDLSRKALARMNALLGFEGVRP